LSRGTFRSVAAIVPLKTVAKTYGGFAMDTTPHQDDEIERALGDYAMGAEDILVFLIKLGVLRPDATVDAVYYLRRTGRWPIGSDGGKLIASKRRLSNHAAKLARGSHAA
jgi:hypothetical protein